MTKLEDSLDKLKLVQLKELTKLYKIPKAYILTKSQLIEDLIKKIRINPDPFYRYLNSLPLIA